MALDLQDELGLPWDEMADGRVHRLIKGRDFVRSADMVEEAAVNASRRLQRVVRTYKETRWGVVYFWVQFVDHEVLIGDPCPCGGTLLQVNQNFAECASCKASVALVKPKPERPVEDDLLAEDDPLLQSLFGAAPAPRRAAQRAKAKPPREPKEEAPARDSRADPDQLRAYSDVSLYWSATDRTRERMVGHGLDHIGRPHLLVVDFAMDRGKRVPDPDRPGDWQHTVWSVPTGPFGELIRLDRLRNRPPAPEIEEPSPASGGRSPAPRALPMQLPQPPEHLSAFEDITVVPFGGGAGGGGKGRRFRGHARLHGELVLLTVRYREREGEEIPDPNRPGDTVHFVSSVPVEPFGDVIDLEALLAEDGTEAAGEPEPAADKTRGDIRSGRRPERPGLPARRRLPAERRRTGEGSPLPGRMEAHGLVGSDWPISKPHAPRGAL